MKTTRRLLSILWLVPLLWAALGASARAGTEGWEYAVAAVTAGGIRWISDDFQVVLEGEYGILGSTDLADFQAYRTTAGDELDVPRHYRYALAGSNPAGFRLGLRFRRWLDLTWSRSWADSRYRVWIDGEEQVEDPGATVPVLLPTVRIRMDFLTVAWHAQSLRLAEGLVPVFRAGVGWFLLSQDTDLRPPFRPPVNNSDSRISAELAAGLEWRWRALQLGGELRGFLFRWVSQDDLMPASQVWAGMASIRVGMAF